MENEKAGAKLRYIHFLSGPSNWLTRRQLTIGLLCESTIYSCPAAIDGANRPFAHNSTCHAPLYVCPDSISSSDCWVRDAVRLPARHAYYVPCAACPRAETAEATSDLSLFKRAFLRND